MARIRTVKPEFFSDEKLAAMPTVDRFVFLGLISMADDAGRLIDQIRPIDGYIFPVSDETSEPSLRALTDASVIRRYIGANGQRIIQIVNWHRHQRIERPSQSKLPEEVTDFDLPRFPRFAAVAEQTHRDLTATSPKPHRLDVEVEVEVGEGKGAVQTQIGRDGTAAIARAVTGPRSLEIRKSNGNHAPQEVHVPPRPPGVPDPDHALPAPNGPEPYLDDRRAAAAWVKQHPAEFAELQRRVTLENPHSESASGRKAFLSALLLGRVVRILRGHDPLPLAEGPAQAVQGMTHRASDAETCTDGPPPQGAQAQGASNAPVVSP